MPETDAKHAKSANQDAKAERSKDKKGELTVNRLSASREAHHEDV
jgi:hypothetical protein